MRPVKMWLVSSNTAAAGGIDSLEVWFTTEEEGISDEVSSRRNDVDSS